jgi:hypothetical protein
VKIKRDINLITARTPRDLHDKLAMIATRRGISLSDALIEAAEDYIKKNESLILSLWAKTGEETGASG